MWQSWDITRPAPKHMTDSQAELNWFQRAYTNVMKHAVAMNQGASAAPKRDYVPKATDSARVQQIQANLRGMAFRNDWTRVVLPTDDCGCGGAVSAQSIRQAQEKREVQFRKEVSAARFSNFMVTPTDAHRMNNPAQASFNKQRQLTIPSTTGQFYAFMHAISAAFGSLDS